MNIIDKEDLQREVSHIFDSGANEIRIMNMFQNFIDSRGYRPRAEVNAIAEEYHQKGITASNK